MSQNELLRSLYRVGIGVMAFWVGIVTKGI